MAAHHHFSWCIWLSLPAEWNCSKLAIKLQLANDVLRAEISLYCRTRSCSRQWLTAALSLCRSDKTSFVIWLVLPPKRIKARLGSSTCNVQSSHMTCTQHAAGHCQSCKLLRSFLTNFGSRCWSARFPFLVFGFCSLVSAPVVFMRDRPATAAYQSCLATTLSSAVAGSSGQWKVNKSRVTDAWQRSGRFGLAVSWRCRAGLRRVFPTGPGIYGQICFTKACATVGILSEFKAWRCIGFQTLSKLLPPVTLADACTSMPEGYYQMQTARAVR